METGYKSGNLLVANGSLLDPNFRQTVVLLCEHSGNGAYGLVLNRPSEHLFSDMFPDKPAFQAEKSRLYSGGPCETDRIQVLHNFDEEEVGGVRLFRNVVIGGDMEKIVKMRKQRPDTACRYFMGYSGWGEGQLENEMESQSWVVSRASSGIVFKMDHRTLWNSILRDMGGYYSFLATMPSDVRMN
jgi:putative transcriptional regulator